MADQANQPAAQKDRNAKPANPGQLGNDDDVRHAPESGEPTETGRAGAQGAKGANAGERDESGRQGRS